jgi:hypothetical protein
MREINTTDNCDTNLETLNQYARKNNLKKLKLGKHIYKKE